MSGELFLVTAGACTVFDRYSSRRDELRRGDLARGTTGAGEVLTATSGARPCGRGPRPRKRWFRLKRCLASTAFAGMARSYKGTACPHISLERGRRASLQGFNLDHSYARCGAGCRPPESIGMFPEGSSARRARRRGADAAGSEESSACRDDVRVRAPIVRMGLCPRSGQTQSRKRAGPDVSVMSPTTGCADRPSLSGDSP